MDSLILGNYTLFLTGAEAPFVAKFNFACPVQNSIPPIEFVKNILV